MALRHWCLAALLPFMGGSAVAQTAAEPPLWADLAECSAVFAAIAGSDGYAGNDSAEIERADRMAAAFLASAEVQARVAGQSDPRADVASIMVYLTPRWTNRIGQLPLTASNLRWIAFCGDLGRDQRILPLPAQSADQ